MNQQIAINIEYARKKFKELELALRLLDKNNSIQEFRVDAALRAAADIAKSLSLVKNEI